MAKPPPSFLSAAWWNERINNTMDRLDALFLGRALGKFLESNYLPLETPVTPEVLRRMTPDQFAGYVGTLPTIEEKVEAIQKLGRVPPSLLPSGKAAKRTLLAP